MIKTLIFSLTLTISIFSQTWVVQTIDDNNGAGGLGDYTSISTDIVNNPNITYREVGVQFKYARWSGNWSLETIDFANSGRWTVDIGMDKYDTIPHITYGDNTTGAIYHYSRISALWVQDTVSTGTTGFTADMTRMKLDGNNNIHVICTDNVSPFPLKYFYGAGSSTKTWTSTDIATNVASKSINLVMDVNKLPNIAYYGQSPKNPYYGYKTSGGTWNIGLLNSDVVTSLRVGIDVDKANVVHIAYIAGGALKYSTGTWSSFSTAVTIDSGLGGGTGHVAIATNSSNVPYIAYYNATTNTLKCANFKNSVWTVETVDATAGVDVGQYCSIAIGTNDIPQIAYYDATNKYLKYAKIVMPPPPDKLVSLKLINNLFKPKSGEYMNIQYTTNIDGNVVIKIYNLAGDLIKEVKNGAVPAGTYIERWYGDDRNGVTAATGTYFVTINYENIKSTKKAIILK